MACRVHAEPHSRDTHFHCNDVAEGNYNNPKQRSRKPKLTPILIHKLVDNRKLEFGVVVFPTWVKRCAGELRSCRRPYLRRMDSSALFKSKVCRLIALPDGIIMNRSPMRLWQRRVEFECRRRGWKRRIHIEAIFHEAPFLRMFTIAYEWRLRWLRCFRFACRFDRKLRIGFLIRRNPDFFQL